MAQAIRYTGHVRMVPGQVPAAVRMAVQEDQQLASYENKVERFFPPKTPLYLSSQLFSLRLLFPDKLLRHRKPRIPD